MNSTMSMMDFLQHLDDRALYNMTGILDYDTNLRIVGGVLLICLLLRATLIQYHCEKKPSIWIASSAQRVKALVSTVKKVFWDFQSGTYYQPFGRKTALVIRSTEAIQELCEAPQLSQAAAYGDIFGFQLTISHKTFDWEPSDHINLRHRLATRAIRAKGLPQIESLFPYLQAGLNQTIAQNLEAHTSSDAGEKEFSWAMSQYYNDTVSCMGAFQIVPAFLRRFTYKLITKGGRALDVLVSRLDQAADPERDAWREEEPLKSVTLFYNMLEGSKDSNFWTPLAVIQGLLGIWFAASHQPWINLHFVLLELCNRPEYVELIRDEIEGLKGHLDHNTICQLPILDSFIKESVRLNPLDKVAIRRKAVQPFVFRSTGCRVPVGQIVCVPAWEFMHDKSRYPNPEDFDGHRFVRNSQSRRPSFPENPMRGTTFTDASEAFPIWGLGSKVCPGRWHASLIIKMVLVKLIQDYDFRLEAGGKRVKWFWETFQMPYEGTRVLMKKRNAFGKNP
ncbi:cytochrome P450 [Physcia stellaris]|nr:cytochrome P450 [Physcia stellaris]